MVVQTKVQTDAVGKAGKGREGDVQIESSRNARLSEAGPM
jgi:hypothetical protein